MQWTWRALVLFVGLLGLNCRDATSPRVRAGHVALAPVFQSGSAGIVDFDRLRITVVRPPSAQVLDTIISISPTADSVDLSLRVPLASASEDLLLYLRLLNAAGDTVFQNVPYPQSVTVTSGTVSAPVTVPIAYVGVGYDAVSVVIVTPDTSLLFGDTLQLVAAAWGHLGNIIPGTPIAWRSLDSLRVRIADRAKGRLVGATQRGIARIVAQLLTGPADTVLVTAQPVPSQLTLVSGDAQTAVPAAALPLPLRVRVLAVDGLGVRVPVRFRAISPGALVSDSVVMSDSLGYAEVIGTLGSAVGPQTFEASVSHVANPVTFRATSVSGTVASVTLNRTVDTIARAATLKYTATARDSLGNPVNVTIGWRSTVLSVATVDTAGLALALAADSTKIIAAAAGHADTALLYVRALSRVVPLPSDTVVTAIGDTLDIRATAYDNFGAVVTSGFTQTYLSATPTVVSVNATTGRTRSVGAGNGVVIVRDFVDSALTVQGTATIRVNQVTASIRNTPALPDSLQVGVGGHRPIIAQALDRNGNPIPNKTFGFRSVNAVIATVDIAGIVTGVALGPTFVVDSVDGFKDSVKVAVVLAPPSLLQWGYDSLSVGNGGSVSVPLTLSRTDPGPVTVLLSSSDSMIARPAASCPGASLKRIQIPPLSSSTSVLICGVAPGRVTIVAQDSANVFLPDTMIVTVVSTIEFREIGQFSRQTNFYANQNETHNAQVFLSDPAPAGGLGVTFVYGRAGTSAVTPAPAIIPAGQLAANITIQGLAPGRDSVVPSSGGFVGKFSFVDVAPDSLRMSVPYPQVVGVGQLAQPYVSYTYAMDHTLLISLGLAPAIGTVPDTVRVQTGYNYRDFMVRANALGLATVSATATGWVGASDTIRFTTPQLGASGTISMIAGYPTKGYWGVTSEDSITRYSHPVADTLTVSAVSRDTNIVAVDAAVGKINPGQASIAVYNALRAQPSAGGDSTWIVLTAPPAASYRPDSFLVRVSRPALTFSMSYPNQVLVGGKFQNAGDVTIPYVRPDSFTVLFGHTRRGIVSGPDSVTIPKGQTYASFDITGDTVATDTISVTRATGYTLPAAQAFNVVPLHVSIYNQPTTLYTISRPQIVSVSVHQATSPYYGNPLVSPLRVSLASSDTLAFKLDSAAVTIPAGAYISNYDTLRVPANSPGNDSGRILISAPGSTNDSSNIIKVLPTPLTLNMPYPQQTAFRLKLQGASVSIPDIAPDTVQVSLSHLLPAADSLSTLSVKIPKGQYSSNTFDVLAHDSVGSDSVKAAAVGYVSDTRAVTMVQAQVDVQDIGGNHLTTEPPYRVITYVRMRQYPAYTQNAIDTIRFTIATTDSKVMQIDSAATVTAAADSGTSVVPKDLSYAYFKVRFVGSGTARIIVSAPSFGVDTMAPVTVSGPALHFGAQNLTVGTGQIFQNQYVFVDNPTTNSLVVRLSKSDSTLPAASQAFTLSADSVIIPQGQLYSSYFNVTGQTKGSAQLIAQAAGYGQVATPVDVGTPQLSAPATQTLYVGEVPRNVATYTVDQAGQGRVVASPLVVSQTVTDPAVAQGDSASRTIPAAQAQTSFNFRGLKAGSVDAIFAASGYKSDTMVVTVDTGQLSFVSYPMTIGPNQSAQMYVQVPFSNDSAVVVTLTTSPVGLLSVPPTVTIPARTGYVYFDVVGVSFGAATISGSAAIARNGTSPAIQVSKPQLQLTLSANTNVGQKSTLTVYAEDSLGTPRNLAVPLTVTLTSSDLASTVFDSATITIPAGSYYASTGVTFTQAGTYTITGTAQGYTPGTTQSTATGALVTMQSNLSFSPPIVTIKAGQYVTWRNDDTISHTTTEDSATPVWDSGQLVPGRTFERYFGSAGTFTYNCRNHPSMTGTVIVTP